jgi:hypothetical protein
MEEYLLLGDISTEEWEVKQFLESVNDVQFNNIAYQAVPNVMLVSRSIGMMLSAFSIPDGAVHTSQEIYNFGVASFGDVVQCYSKKEKERITGGMKLFGVSCKFYKGKDNILCESRSIVIVKNI